MFNFFRRTKSDNKDKKHKETIKEQNVSPTLDRRDMCKNNLTTPKVDGALQGNSFTSLPNATTEFGLLENPTNATGSSEVAALVEKNDSNLSNAPNSELNTIAMSENTSASPNLTPTTVSYAKMLKRFESASREPVKEHRSAGVKPCGHGTTAIGPSIPLIGNKRENTSTPPESPLLEAKKLIKQVDQHPIYQRQRSNKSDTKNINESSDTESTKSNVLNVIASGSSSALTESIRNTSPLSNTTVNGEDKKNLINQEAKFQSQLNDLSKQLSIRDAEANKLRFQMEELQRDVFAKSAGMDRLQAELQAAHKETEIVRQRIKHLENDLVEFKQRNDQMTNELTNKSDNYVKYENEANIKIAELESTINQLRLRIESLEEQLESLKQEKIELEKQHALLLEEREEERKKLEETINQAKEQKVEIEKKWKEDFEKLRTINIMKEQQLLDDFEWKLREVQQTCKKRLDDKDKTIEEKLQDAYREAEKKMKEAEEMMTDIDTLKSYELEIEQLRGLTVDQEKALKEMIEQHEQMKVAEDSLKNEAKRLRTLIEMEKENLLHMQRIHHQEIVDKERTLQQTLNEKRTEIAMYWEERLLHECGRLKSELEQIHNEEKLYAMQTVRRDKNDEFERAKNEWETKLREHMKEIDELKKTLINKDEFYHEEIIRTQTKTDRDILELRRLMDKIDMMHHNRFDNLVLEHDKELERINEETEQKIKEIETSCQNQVTSLKTSLDLIREQMEKESQQKIESLIEQHRKELDSQWENLIHQKSEAVQLVEDEYVLKYKTLEEQFYTQQNSHDSREIELLKTIDSLKNELSSKESTIDDLQNNVDTLEGGVQVLNQEIAQQNDQIMRNRRESDQKIRGLQETITKQQQSQENEREAFRIKLMGVQKQTQETIDHLQRKCQCLTKLFEEVRLRYERRESRQEDLNIISDLRQVIAEQEKDLACLNEEKRYFQMRLMNLENQFDGNASGDEDTFEDAVQTKPTDYIVTEPPPTGLPPAYSVATGQINGPNTFSIPPTIIECDDCDE